MDNNENPPQEQQQQQQLQPSLTQLNDYELIEIFKYLNSTDLWQLSRISPRFRYLLRTKKLWRRVELRDAPRCADKVAFGSWHANEQTRDVRLAADERFRRIAPEDLRRYFTGCPNLTVLALENQRICGKELALKDFPANLVELSLRKTFVTYPATFLECSHKKLINLKSLILDQCLWVEAMALVPLSKYESLEILSLYNCRKMNDADMAYISLAGRFGFKSLRIIDCRFSGLGDQILRTFYSKVTIEEVYFQNYLRTYFLEKSERELEISEKPATAKPYSYPSEFDDIPMYDREIVENVYRKIEYRKQRDFSSVSDEGTVVYHFTWFSDEGVSDQVKFESVLYKKPYEECKCFWGKEESENSKVTGHNSKGPRSKMKSLKRKNVAKIEANLEKEIEYFRSNHDSREPNVLVIPEHEEGTDSELVETEANLDDPKTHWVRKRLPRNPYEMAMLENADLNANRDLAESSFVRRMLDNHGNSSNSSSPDPSGCRRVVQVSLKRKRDDESSAESAERGSVVIPRLEERDAPAPAGPPAAGHYLLVNVLCRPCKRRVALSRLSLRGFRDVTDKSLCHLGHLRLRLLDVTGTAVSAAAARRFARRNPDCRVVHESACRCRPEMHF